MVFLHGRHAESGDWTQAISDSLAEHEGTVLPAATTFVELNYTEALHAAVTAVAPGSRNEVTEHASFAERQTEARARLSNFTTRPPSPYDFFPKEFVTTQLIRRMPEIDRYRREPDVRRAVRSQCLEQLPQGTTNILIAHSLGAVVAFDLLHYLPPGYRIDLLLTIGSPMARRPWRHALAEFRGEFPTRSLGSWVNVVNRGDWVTAGDGISLWFPQAVDVFANFGLGVHGEVPYLSSGAAAAAIAHALHDSSALSD